MNMERSVDKEDLSWTISLCVILSKVIFYRFLEEVQATKIRLSNPRSHLLKILPGSLLKFLSSQIHFQGVGLGFCGERRILMVVQIKIPFLRISQPKCALSLKWIFISCFKPILVLKLS
jgi:hypothetical protein